MILLYEEESHIRSYQARRATWSETGMQRRIPTYGHHAKVTLFGTVNAENGDFFCVLSESCDAEAFLDFLKQTLARYADKYIVMVLDNARIHHAKLLRPFLEEHQHRLFLIFLPPYSPERNPIERIWGWLKEAVILNRFHKDQEAFQQSITSFIEWMKGSPEKILKRLGCTV
ncbi:IS630 family transposase [Bacillus sp. CGMCC 1.60114]|uniref:IS630 family transposase n=1 Tax=unclassified Bacillus (in: firmicutes) TaxID=185979 RepID=UPI00362783B9